MNKVTLFFVIITLIISCKKDSFNTSNKLENLSVDKIISLLPIEELDGHSEVIFTSTAGEMIILEYEITKDSKNKKVNDYTYEAEEISIVYVDQSTDDYSLYISGSGNYIEESISNLYISCGIRQFTTGYSPIITISEDGQPVLARYFESISIANKTFYDVYTNHKVDGYEAYGRIYYNAKYGIIGFADSNGEIYSLEEIRD